MSPRRLAGRIVLASSYVGSLVGRRSMAEGGKVCRGGLAGSSALDAAPGRSLAISVNDSTVLTVDRSYKSRWGRGRVWSSRLESCKANYENL